ncbi:MAG: phosphatidate cytidylyltransferase [Vicinamibacterales bacterium]
MVRVLSALVLLPLVVAIIGLMPAFATDVLAAVVAVLAFTEYATIAGRMRVTVWRTLGAAFTVMLCLAIGLGLPLDVVVIAFAVALGGVAVAFGRPDRELYDTLCATLFGVLYVGAPIGALIAIRGRWGPSAVFLVLFTVIVSDTAQYYAGRLFGHTPLAPALSPKKTVEGAIGGLIAASIAVPVLALWWLPGRPQWLLAGVGAVLALVGIIGDLFESQLKRTAGVKDASGLIPGHGGMLDRIDSLLFVAPVFYVFMLALPTP